jgi:hypothetical protein
MRTTAFPTALLLLVACGGSSDATTDDTDSDVVGDSDTGEEGGATLQGTVTDAEGAAVAPEAMRVQFCRGDSCRVAQDFAEGVYAFTALPPGPGSLELVPLGGDLATAFVPVDIAADAERTIDVVVPDLGAATALTATAAEVEVIDGLFVTASTSSLEAPNPLLPAPTALRAVDATSVAMPIDFLTGEVVALFYMDPFDYKATDTGAGVPVRFDNAWSLADDEAHLYMGDYYTASWIDLGPLATDGDGKLVPETAPPRVSTLLILKTAPSE